MANMTTRSVATPTELQAADMYLWGHKGAAPAADRRIAATDIPTRNASNKYGFGIAATLGRVHVQQDGSAANVDGIAISGSLGSAGFGQALGFYHNSVTVRAGYVGCNANAGGGASELHFGTTNNLGVTNASTKMVLNGDGNMCVGKLVPIAAARLTVERDGSAGSPAMSLNHTAASGTRYLAAFYITGVEVGSIISTGTTTAYQTLSDHRLKNNIRDLSGSGDFIDALRPRAWDWVQDGSPGVGFIAHEFAEVSPSSVSGVKDGTRPREIINEETGEKETIEEPAYQAMQASTSEVMAHVIAELQSLRARVAALESAAQ